MAVPFDIVITMLSRLPVLNTNHTSLFVPVSQVAPSPLGVALEFENVKADAGHERGAPTVKRTAVIHSSFTGGNGHAVVLYTHKLAVPVVVGLYVQIRI